jgi:hypothetical protein
MVRKCMNTREYDFWASRVRKCNKINKRPHKPIDSRREVSVTRSRLITHYDYDAKYDEERPELGR